MQLEEYDSTIEPKLELYCTVLPHFAYILYNKHQGKAEDFIRLVNYEPIAAEVHNKVYGPFYKHEDISNLLQQATKAGLKLNRVDNTDVNGNVLNNPLILKGFGFIGKKEALKNFHAPWSVHAYVLSTKNPEEHAAYIKHILPKWPLLYTHTLIESGELMYYIVLPPSGFSTCFKESKQYCSSIDVCLSFLVDKDSTLLT